MIKTSDYFHSRAEAEREARTAIWGEVSFAKREHVGPRNRPDVAFFDHRGLPVIAVTAQVNNDLVVIHFDGFGRKERIEVLPR